MSRKKKRIALDVDGVLCCFSAGVIKRAKELGLEDGFPKSWEEVDCWDMGANFSKIMKDAWLDEIFWAELPPLRTEPLPFIPYAYITSRPIKTEVTARWLEKHGFPKAKVITVDHPKDKLQHLLNHKIDVLIDDLYKTVREAREAEVESYLYEAPYQRGHEEECKGLPKIKTLEEILHV